MTATEVAAAEPAPDRELMEIRAKVHDAIVRRVQAAVRRKLPFVTNAVANEVAEAVGETVADYLRNLFDVGGSR